MKNQQADSPPAAGETIWELEGMDAFHRAKRVALVFISGALVTSLNTGAVDPKISSALTSVSIDGVTLWWLFWGAAGYYSYAAYQELQLVRARARPFSIEFAGSNLNDAFNKLKIEIESLSDYIRSHQEPFEPSPPKFSTPQMDISLRRLNIHDEVYAVMKDGMNKWMEFRSIKPESGDFKRLWDNMRPTRDLIMDRVTERVVLPYAKERQELAAEITNWRSARSAFETARRGLAEWQAWQERGIEQAVSKCESLFAAVSEMSPKIAQRRRDLLWRWEVWAPTIYIAVCLVIGAPEFVAGFQRAVTLPQIIDQHREDLVCAVDSGKARCDRPVPKLPPDGKPRS